MQADGSHHDPVVVVVGGGAERAVVLLLVDGHLGDGVQVALNVGLVADASHEVGDDHRLGLAVGVEAVFRGDALGNLRLRGSADVEVVVHPGDAAEDKFRLVAVRVVVLGLDGVALDDQLGVVVERGYLCRLPGQQVVVDVPVPFRHHLGCAAEHHPVAVYDEYVAPVRVLAPSAHVHGDEVAACHALFGLLRQHPHLQQAAPVVDEVEVLQGGLALHAVALHLADMQGLAARLLQLVQVVEAEDVAPAVSEGFDVVAGKLGHHVLVVDVVLAFEDVPVDGLEGRAQRPQVPVIFAGVEAARWRVVVVLVVQQPLGEGRLVLHGAGVFLKLEPRDEDGAAVALPLLGRLVGAVEEVAHAVGRGLYDLHRERGHEQGGGDGADDVLGLLAVGVFPQTYFGVVDAGDVAATPGGGVVVGAHGDDGVPCPGDVRPLSVGDDAVQLRALVGREGQFRLLGATDEPGGQVLQHLAVHGLDFARRGAVLCHDGRIPALLVHQLNPGDVELHQRGASPLSGFEQDDADRNPA